MIERERFRSLWNSVAVIIFFSGVFLGLDVFGFGAIGVAIFMWIIGSTVTNIIYGPRKKKTKSKKPSVPQQRVETEGSKFCPSCGEKNINAAEFCIECGTSLSKITNQTHSKK